MADNVSLRVRLDRESDRQRPCCDNIAIIRPTSTMHAGELRCAQCGAFRGWASKELVTFVTETSRRVGAPAEPLVWRQQQQENKVAFEPRDNSATIFVNDRKTEDKHPDSTGSAKIGGVDYWVSAWRRQSKSGKAYLSLSFKQKQEAVDKSKPLRDDLNDSIGF